MQDNRHGAPPAPAGGAEHKPFWDWVAANSAELSKIERGDEPIANALAKQLH